MKRFPIRSQSGALRNTIISACTVFALNPATGLAAEEPIPFPEATSTARFAPRTTGFVLSAEAASGFGRFQDIQVPFDRDAGFRIDGTASSEENIDHLGIPLSAGILGEWRGHETPVGRLDFGLNLQMTRMESTTGTPDTRAASYSRVDLGGFARSTFNVADQDLFARLGTGLRRSAFMNVSTGHFIDAAMLYGSVGIKNQGTAEIELSAGISPFARFGYDEGKGFATEAMKNSTARIVELGTRVSLIVFQRTWLDTAVEHEQSTITLADIGAYESFGLSAEGIAKRQRTWTMQTTIAKIGLRREF